MDEVRSRREVEIRKIASRLREQYQKRMQTALQEMHIHYKVKMQQNSFKRSHYVYCEGESDNLTTCVDDGLICCEHLSEININKIKISQMNPRIPWNKIVKKFDLSNYNTRKIPVNPLTRHSHNTASDEQQ